MNKKTIVLLDIDYTLFDTKTFKDSGLTNYILYDEVLQVLGRLRGTVELGIFSKGEIEFQNAKLNKTEIKDFFNKDNVHIFEDKDININQVLEKYKDHRIFLVDDKLSILYAAKIYNPAVFSVWVKRGPFAQNQKPLAEFLPDVTLENLSSLDKIISQH
jgi:phosphoglycolate phosphatase-like HAD superfamily hydrolase